MLTPSFNLHTAEGREDYEHFLADNDNHIELEQLRQDRLDEVVMWMNHTFFYEAYVSEGECQFDPSFDRLKNCQTRSDLWQVSGWMRNPPRWYKDRRSMRPQFDLTIDEDDDVIAETTNIERMSILDDTTHAQSSKGNVADAEASAAVNYNTFHPNNDGAEPTNVGTGAATNPFVSIAEAPPCPPSGGHGVAIGSAQQGDVSERWSSSSSSSSLYEYVPPAATVNRNRTLLAGNGMMDKQVCWKH